MAVLERIHVDGFWGTHTVEFVLDSQVNFLIGINGSGKTTVINLVAAALTADIATLERIDFKYLKLVIWDPDTRSKPVVEISKIPEAKKRYGSIEYKIRDTTGAKPVRYELDDLQEWMHFESRGRYFSNIGSSHHPQTRPIAKHVGQLVKVSWLSVHRATPSDEVERKSYESTVDRKLDELSNRLVRFFSSLSQKGSEKLEDFQKTVFLSMLGHPTDSLSSSLTEDELEHEKDALNAIFAQFQLDKGQYTNRVDAHFKTLDRARRKLSETKEGALKISEIATILANSRIDTIVEEWTEIQRLRERIYEPRTTFLKILNDHMQRKEFSITDRNELVVTTQSGKILPLELLSSGEKQLLIVLGEALLQERESWVYIADEPELSLHVKWQERLVDSLLAINPNAQILFATHSPDVVSSYGSQVLDMENLYLQ